MVDNKMNKQTFLYQFLIEPRYRIARHILLLAAVTAVSLNQNIYTFGARIEQLGNLPGRAMYPDLLFHCRLSASLPVGSQVAAEEKVSGLYPLLFRVRLITPFAAICTGILDIHLIRYSSRQRFLF